MSSPTTDTMPPFRRRCRWRGRNVLPKGAIGMHRYELEWLPPVGDQHMPNCFVWASVYGLATFYAARKNNTPPTTPDLQASPDYAYIRYQTSIKMARNTCQGGQVGKVLNWLKANGGTPSLAAAPNFGKQGSQSSCDVNWTKYGPQPIPPDPKFLVPEWKATTITGKDGLENMRTVIARGNPIAFGVNLYTDFPHYRGKRSALCRQWKIHGKPGQEGWPCDADRRL